MDDVKSVDHVGPPRLLEHSCQVITTDCLLNLNVEDRSCLSNKTKSIRYSVKLTPATLDTLLASFENIKNQLAALVKK